MKLLTRRRKRVAPIAENGSYDAAALVTALAEGRWAVPDRFNFTRDVVEVLARDPKRRALTFLGKDGVIEPRSFLLIAEGAARWATLLRENGVEPGDRVLVLASKTPDWLEVMLATLKVGAVAVPCPETMSASSLGVRISVSEAKLVVAGEASRDEVARIVEAPPVLYIGEMRALKSKLPDEAPTHDTSSRDPAFILSTSGTATGPRSVVHTHGAAFAARVAAEHWLDAGPHDSVWCTADASSGTAVWNALLGPWSRGAEIVLHQEDFDPHERLQCIRRLDATILCQTPAEYRALLSAADLGRYRPPKLRRLVSTGEHLSPDVIAAYEQAWDLTICDGYGQAETGVVVANGAGPGFRAGSIGVALPGFDVAVVDEQGNEVEPGVVGELAIRGRPPTLFVGYWEAPEETKATFRGDTYLTADTAVSDEDGFLWFLGRSADVILSGGGRFGPVEVEEVLTRHDAVADAAVVGMRDLQRGGQFVRAFVVPANGLEASDRLAAEIREHARQSLAAHKVPREIEFVDLLPTTADGKIKRLELRERPLSGLAPEWSPPPSPSLAPEPASERQPAPETAGLVEAPTAEPALYEQTGEPTLAEPYVEPEPWVEPPAGTAPLESVPETTGRAGMLDLEPRARPEPVLEAAPEPAYEPELDPEPRAVAETSASEPALEREPQPVPEHEPVEPEAVAEPVFEPAQPEATVAQEADATSGPEPKPNSEPEPTADAGLEPPPSPELALVSEAEPASRVENVAEAVAASEAEAVVEEPAPEPQPDPLPEPEPRPEPEPQPEPAPEPEQVAEVIPLVEPAPEPEDLPDFIVVPGRDERKGEQPAAPSTQDPSGLGFPPITELILEREPRESPPKPENHRPAPEHPLTERRGGKDRRRSSHEPGDENDETGWMQDLSNRLSAYSLSEDLASAPERDEDSSEDEEPS